MARAMRCKREGGWACRYCAAGRRWAVHCCPGSERRMRVLPDFYPDDPNNSVPLPSALSDCNCGANWTRAGKMRTRFEAFMWTRQAAWSAVLSTVAALLMRLRCRASWFSGPPPSILQMSEA